MCLVREPISVFSAVITVGDYAISSDDDLSLDLCAGT